MGSIYEHLRVAASVQGYKINFESTSRDKWFLNERMLVAKVYFEKSDRYVDSLGFWYRRRKCSRSLYAIEPLPELFKEDFLAEVRSAGDNVTAKVISPTRSLARKAAAIECIRWKIRQSGKNALSWIRWDSAEYERRNDGIPVSEFSFLSRRIRVFGILSNMRLLPKSLLSLIIGRAVRSKLEKCILGSGGLVLISVRADNGLSVEMAGILATRLWWIAAKYGLSMHPLSVASMLIYSNRCGELPSYMGKFNRNLIESWEKECRTSFSVPKDMVPVWLLRVGRPLNKEHWETLRRSGLLGRDD